MCGICGLAALGGDLEVPAAEAGVARMLEALQHRGPDAIGQASAGTAVLGATRLAIRGPESGVQPLRDAASGVIAVCNGEIDNHAALRTWLVDRGRRVDQATDIAVIPALYLELGLGFTERLEGAFAIALWDPRVRRLVLVRDRAGERPLFYHHADGRVWFATEIAALVRYPAVPLETDRASLAHYLRFGSFVAPGTPLAGIRKVPPGTRLSFEGGQVREERYWRWQLGAVARKRPREVDFDRVFRAAVERQSDVDVPYGVFLSGGVDSSLVAAVAHAVRPDYPLCAYTLRFREDSFDEGAFAEQVAEQLGLKSTAVWVEPDDFPTWLPELIRMAGEPLADPAWVPTAMLARRAAQDVKLALVGEGGDEVFGGYPTYPGALLADGYARVPRPIRAMLERLVDRWPPSDRKVTVSFLLKRFVAGADLPGLARHLLWTSNIPPTVLDALGVTVRPDPVGRAGGMLLDVIQRHDLESTLAEGLLTKADRASMGSALELRAPFLDRAVLDYAATLPVAERVHALQTKAFLKRYALRYLPRSIVHRRKRGLSVPLSTWLRDPLHAWARERLAAGRLEVAGIRSAAALDLLEDHRQRRADHARPIWTLLVLDAWLAWLEGVPASR